MGLIKERNGMDLTEAEDIKREAGIHRRTVQKHLHDPNNHDAVITHLEPDILEFEVKWALESITTSITLLASLTKLVDVMEFQLSSFKS